MKTYKIASIDIGSNAARLLIKSITVNDEGLCNFYKDLFFRYPLRLGDEVFTKGEISKQKGKEIQRMMKAFKNLMRLYGVDYWRACATSAMREASNGAEIVKNIHKKTGIKIEVISGDEEAQMEYGCHIELMMQKQTTCAFVDVGGGSTEVTLVKQGEVMGYKSYPNGTIRMLHRTETENETEVDKMIDDLKQQIKGLGNVELVGSGGNINKLWKLGANKKNGSHLPVETLERWYNDLHSCTLKQRMEKYQLKRDRADVIVPAAYIFMRIAQALQVKFIEVPNLGLADGIVDGLFDKIRNEEKKQ